MEVVDQNTECGQVSGGEDQANEYEYENEQHAYGTEDQASDRQVYEYENWEDEYDKRCIWRGIFISKLVCFLQIFYLSTHSAVPGQL